MNPRLADIIIIGFLGNKSADGARLTAHAVIFFCLLIAREADVVNRVSYHRDEAVTSGM